MKNLKKILCLAFTALFILQLSACKNKSEPQSNNVQPEKTTEQTIKYTEKWLRSPSIQAQVIYSLPIVKFNQDTNHYDLTFGDNFIIKKDDKYGLIDSNGTLVISPEFDSIETCPCYEGYIVTVKEGEYYTTTYHIDSNNQKLWSYDHTCKGFSGYTFRWDKASSSVKSVNISADTAYPAQLSPYIPEAMQICDGDTLTDKFTLVSLGKAVSAKEYTGAGVFTGGIAAVRDSNGKWGYIDSEGKTVIPFEFDAIEGYNALKYEADTPFECSEGYVTVLKGGKFGIYTADGDMIVPCQYACLTPVHNGRAFASQDGSSWGILTVDEKISNGISSEDESTTVSTW